MRVIYPWPTEDPDGELQSALDIALDYLGFTGQAYPYSTTERVCAYIILAAWRAGARHKIRLANCAILAIEKKQPISLTHSTQGLDERHSVG